uniref:P-loop containing nucleoside triphosphate hydrolase protein n=1 Tax=Globodera pallida TaxID=36090 RepID=A0A183CN10_GLOPA
VLFDHAVAGKSNLMSRFMCNEFNLRAASLVKTGTSRQRSGRQFRERMERQLGPDWKETLKQQRHARRHQTQPSIASGYFGAKARQFQKYVQRMKAHKKRIAFAFEA